MLNKQYIEQQRRLYEEAVAKYHVLPDIPSLHEARKAIANALAVYDYENVVVDSPAKLLTDKDGSKSIYCAKAHYDWDLNGHKHNVDTCVGFVFSKVSEKWHFVQYLPSEIMEREENEK